MIGPRWRDEGLAYEMEEPFAFPICFFAPALTRRVKRQPDFKEVPRSEYSQVLRTFGLHFLEATDTDEILSILPGLSPDPAHVVQDEVEAKLIRSATHPKCGLFLEEPSRVPSVRMRSDVGPGVLLGQLACVVRRADSCEPQQDSISSAIAACSCFRYAFRTKRALGTPSGSAPRVDAPRAMLGRSVEEYEPLNPQTEEVTTLEGNEPEVRLQFDGGTSCNIFGLMRSCHLENVQPNVQVVLCIVDDKPVLCVESIVQIPQHTELLYDWGEGNLSRLLRVLLWAQCSHSHALHIYRRRLEQLYEIYGLPRPALEPVRPLEDDPAVFWLGHLREGSMNVWDTKFAQRHASRYSQDIKCPTVTLKTVMEETGCKLIVRTEASASAKTVIASMEASGRPPRWQDEFADKLQLATQLMYTLECPSVELRRVDYLHHPVRYLNPPGKPQYAVFAKSAVLADTPVVCYKGEVVTLQEFDRLSAPQYTFDFNLEEGLYINAKEIGNEGRFVNDCFARVWHTDGNEGANARYLVCWDDTYNVPVLFIVAGKDAFQKRGISKGEEIVVSYGETFWTPLMHELLRQHSSYYSASAQIVRQLERHLVACDLALPRHLSWKELLEMDEGNLFSGLPRNALQHEAREEFEEEVEIESVLDKRCMRFGVQYLVKWKG